MIDQHVIDQVKTINLISLAEKRTQLHKESAKEMAGPCPLCGGKDRFHCTEEWFFCRQCHEERGDVIEFIQWTEKVSFAEAVAILSGAGFISASEPRRPAARTKKEQPAAWAVDAEKALQAAQQALYSDKDTRGAEYLTKRALTPATWRRFALGYKPDCGLPGTWNAETKVRSYPPQPAILIPWYAGGRLVAIRYRFLELHTYMDAGGKEQTNKQGGRFGSDFAGRVFGGQALARICEDLRTLVITEGEINAMSIHQVAGAASVDVLSLGSESQRLTPALVAYAKSFQRIIAWADRPEVAKALMTALPGAFGVQSPEGKDANDLLRSGHLGGFLAAVRVRACRSEAERQALYWDLWDGCPDDAGVRQVLEQMKASHS